MEEGLTSTRPVLCKRYGVFVKGGGEVKKTVLLILAFMLCICIASAEEIVYVGVRYSVEATGYDVTVFWQDGNRPEDTLLESISTLYFKAYPAMRETYGTTEQKQVRIFLKDAFQMPENVPAYTVGNEIHCSRQFLEKETGNLNCIVHELFHVVQNGYPQSAQDPLASALCEGLADAARYEYSVYEDSAWSLAKYAEGQSYMDSYTVTAAFLVWAAETYDESLCLRLNRILHEGGDAGAAIEVITGKNIETLWGLYAEAAK